MIGFEGEFYLGYYKAIRSEGGSGGGGATGCSGLVDTNCLGTSQTGGVGRGISSTTGSAPACA